MLKIGLIGAGRWGKVYIKTIEKRQEVIDEARWKLFELMSSKMGNPITKPTKVNDFKFFRGAK